MECVLYRMIVSLFAVNMYRCSEDGSERDRREVKDEMCSVLFLVHS